MFGEVFQRTFVTVPLLKNILLTAPNGFAWKSQTADTNLSLEGVTFGANRFVAVGNRDRDFGTVLVSSDARDGDGQIGLSTPAPLVQSQRRLPSGAFEFQISSPLAERVGVQSSSDLRNWTTIETLQVTNGWSAFQDPGATNSPRRLYRALWSAP